MQQNSPLTGTDCLADMQFWRTCTEAVMAQPGKSAITAEIIGQVNLNDTDMPWLPGEKNPTSIKMRSNKWGELDSREPSIFKIFSSAYATKQVCQHNSYSAVMDGLRGINWLQISSLKGSKETGGKGKKPKNLIQALWGLRDRPINPLVQITHSFEKACRRKFYQEKISGNSPSLNFSSAVVKVGSLTVEQLHWTCTTRDASFTGQSGPRYPPKL